METDRQLAAIREAVHKLLRSWVSQGNPPATILDDLLIVKQHEATTSGYHPASQVIGETIDRLREIDEEAASILRSRFIDNETLVRVSQLINSSEFGVSRRQKAAIDQIGEMIYTQELLLRQAQIERLVVGLPPPTYSRLFGLEESRQRLEETLLREGDPAVIILVGMGGIGKTALADSVTRAIIQRFRFDSVQWLRLEPPTMSGDALSPQHLLDQLLSNLAERLEIRPLPVTPEERLAKIHHHLKASPHLVVLDNLENTTLTDFLLHRLASLANPSRFLLTSRAYPDSRQTGARRFVLPELSLEAAGDLLRYHAGELGISALAEAGAEPIEEIYAITGGNPLALKLVVSLLDLLPLSQILKDLTRSRQGPIEDLYRHIFWQSWQTLSPAARGLLQAMPLVANAGATPDYLKVISELDGDVFWRALHELHARSLLEVRGTLDEKRYGIHRLTETFVRTEIIGWPEAGGPQTESTT